MRQGYLLCRVDQRTLLDQYTTMCSDRGEPVLRVDRHAQQCQVVLQWHQGLSPLTLGQQDQLRQRLQGQVDAPGLLPIVFRFGAYSPFLSQDAALELASSLVPWIREQKISP